MWTEHRGCDKDYNMGGIIEAKLQREKLCHGNYSTPKSSTMFAKMKLFIYSHTQT